MSRFQYVTILSVVLLLGLVIAVGAPRPPSSPTVLKKPKAELKYKRIRRDAAFKARERQENREWKKLALAAFKEAKRRCANGVCNVSRETLRLMGNKAFVLKVLNKRAQLAPASVGLQCLEGQTQCPSRPASGVAFDCCNEGEICSYANPRVGTSGARCVPDERSCTGSFCEAQNDPALTGVGKLYNCCTGNQVCKVVTIRKALVITVDVPVCHTPPPECPPDKPQKKFKIGGESINVCCEPGQIPDTINGAPYCREVQCKLGTTPCPGKPIACCGEDERCSSSKDGPANCLPPIPTTSTTTTTLPESPTPSPSPSPSPSGSPTTTLSTTTTVTTVSTSTTRPPKPPSPSPSPRASASPIR